MKSTMIPTLPITDPTAPARAAEVIRAGGLIILPTDTVYGVAADLWNPEAMARLYAVKRRPPEKAIPILLSDFEAIHQVAAEISALALTLADAFWPGALTLTVPKKSSLPEIVTSLPTVGVRLPDHPAARAVIRACGGALAVTSANVSGAASPLTFQDALLLEGVDLALDGGDCPGGVSSTVVDISGGEVRVLRAGPISEEDLRAVI
jgi:L-threonylcarbamoyladenylate synthase